MTVARRLLLLTITAAVIAETTLMWFYVTKPDPPPRIRYVERIVGIPESYPVVEIVYLPATPTPLVTSVTSATPETSKRGPRYLDTRDLLALLARSPWPDRYWSRVLASISCEASASGENVGLVDAQAVGDEHLVPLTGPSLGLGQANIAAHPRLALAFDLFNPREALIVMYIQFLEAGSTFDPWSVFPECVITREGVMNE